MIKTLFIHIGVHKTGTTAIQSFLSLNRENLKKYDTFYPGNLSNHYILTQELRETDESWLNKDSETFKIFSEIKDNLQLYKKFVLSSEGFCENDTIILPRLFKTIKHFNLKLNIKIIIFYRPQHTWLESVYQQIVKEKKVRMTKTFEELIKNRVNFSIGDYYQLLGRWSHYFGKKNIIFVRFSKKQRYRKIFIDFISILGLPEKTSLKEPTRENSNIGIETTSIEFLRWLNILNIDDNLFIRVLRALSSEIRAHTDNYNLLTEELNNDIFYYFKDSNNLVASEYLNKNDAILFEDFQIVNSNSETKTNVQNNFFKPELFSNQIELIKENDINILILLFKQLFHNDLSPSENDNNKIAFLELLEENIPIKDINRLKQSKTIDKKNLPEVVSEFNKSKLITNISATNFLNKTFNFSKDILNGIEVTNSIRITSTGNDPYFSIEKFNGNYNSTTIIRIQMTVTFNTTLKIYYQTRSEPNYNESKIELIKFNKGTNYIYLVIDDFDFNGQIRIDPGTISGIYEIREIIVKSNTNN